MRRTEPDSENIYIDLLLEGDYWDRPPVVDVIIDDQLIQTHTVDSYQYRIRFKHQLRFDQPHVLQLNRRGKTDDQNKLLPDGSYQTQTLRIKQVKLDNIDLRNLVWHSCRFYPEYPEPWATQQRDQGIQLETVLTGETTLGHNGVWKFAFTSPIYKFLVSWIRGTRA